MMIGEAVVTYAVKSRINDDYNLKYDILFKKAKQTFIYWYIFSIKLTFFAASSFLGMEFIKLLKSSSIMIGNNQWHCQLYFKSRIEHNTNWFFSMKLPWGWNGLCLVHCAFVFWNASFLLTPIFDAWILKYLSSHNLLHVNNFDCLVANCGHSIHLGHCADQIGHVMICYH